MCYSILMYLHDNYKITATTSFAMIKRIINNADINLILIDEEPTEKLTRMCEELKANHPGLRIVITYVFNNRAGGYENEIRKYIDSIFYKPFNLHDVSDELSKLLD